MKMIAIWVAIAMVAFGAMAVQVGVFSGTPDTEEEVPAPAEPPVPKVVTKFPDDLYPAAQAKAVPTAAEFKPGPQDHRMVIMRVGGGLHPWQEALNGDWQAESVPEAELVVVVGTQKKMFVSHHTYPNGAPPITRYIYELEISVIEAKTGNILANRVFRNEPRPLGRVESWETTQIGRAVSVQQVAGWVQRMAKTGFPDPRETTPIVAQAD